MKMKKYLLMLSFIFLFIMVNFNSYAADIYITKEDVANNINLPNGYYYIISKTDYVYKDPSGVVSNVKKISDLKKEMKQKYYEKFVAMKDNNFADIETLFEDIFYEGSSIYQLNVIETPNIGSYFYEQTSTKGVYSIEGKRFYIPVGLTYNTVVNSQGQQNAEWLKKIDSPIDSVKKEGAILNYTIPNLMEITKSVKEGVIGGGVGIGYNVGAIYSEEKQLPLSEIMEPINASSVQNSTESTTENSTSEGSQAIINTNGTLFKFKNNISVKANFDYFLHPIFGRVDALTAGNIDDVYWDSVKNNLEDYIDGNGVKLSEDYLKKLEEETAFGTNNFVFDNGVESYKNGITNAKTPLKLVDYNIRLGFPSKYNSNYQSYNIASEGGFTALEDYRFSVYNDIIYKLPEDSTLPMERVATSADIKLSRDNLALYHVKDGEKKYGIIVVLEYEEAVYDPNESKVYLTGRQVGFNNDYSLNMKLNIENKEVLYINNIKSGKEGYKLENISFTELGKHTKINIDNQPESLYLDIKFEKLDLNGVPNYYFYIIRNNNYVNDGSLLNWLASDEAKQTYVYVDELRDKIRGEFEITSDITYEEWLEMERIKNELAYEKSMVLPSFIRVITIIIGVLIIIFGMLLILAYWFDIFNTFTEFSILYYISGRNMYPIADNESPEYLNQVKGQVKYVTFIGVLKIFLVCLVLGFLFIELNPLINLLLKLYFFVQQLFGFGG